MWTDNEFRYENRRLHYIRTAAGASPLALLHGVLRSANSFLPLGPLATRYELLALDQRGHGTSDRAAPNYRVADYVRDAVAWVRECVRRPVVVYGHSLGAMVAAAVAAELPDRVRGAILEDPPFQTLGSRIAGSAWQDYFRALAEIAGSSAPIETLVDQLRGVPMRDATTGSVYRLGDLRDAAALRFFASSLRQVDASILDLMLAGRWLEGYDQQRVFQSIRCPVLLVQADAAAGGMLDDADVQLAQSLMKSCHHVRMAGVGHGIHWQRTQDMINLVYSFVESLDVV
ncbi:MAG TPA: alpha/beta hydrolase [Pirellulales bacterium]|nr:alpha/beta hydrolase [Pirellulales bacterium]